MRDVSQYFELIEKAIEYSVATEVKLEILRFGADSGLIEGVVYFADGARLEFTELVMIEQGRPIKLEYRYQFVQSEAPVFRYDNAAHHEHIATHPHHKHVGAEILPAIEPEFHQVLDEAAKLVNQKVSAPGKKRRQGKPGKD
jgi:Family of unknown function (DUF6516)